GKNITHAFERGLKVAVGGSRGEGPGEIVIKKSYFDEHLKEHFENSRNIQAAIIAEKKIDKRIQKAIEDGACVFYPFSLLKNWSGNYKELLEQFESIAEDVWNYVDFDIDGIILETTVERLKDHLGSTRHHHRWQIAFKVNDEMAEVEVLSITPQTSRTGKVTPVAELVPTKLSGALLSRATAHHFGMVRDKGIGPGAIVQLVRSGLVIPKIERVIRKVIPVFPKRCLSCNSELGWEGDNLICLNTTSCPAQIEHTMVHFFKTLGNIDGFGPKVIAKLHEGGVKTIYEIYKMTKGEFSTFGFGPKQSENLEEQLLISRNVEVEDWRFLAAFGVTRMGLGNCEKILQHHDVTDIFDLSIEDMVRIDGFAEVTANAMHDGLQSIKSDFFKIYELGFNLNKTLARTSQIKDTSISGKLIVFTGTMEYGSRKDLEKKAKELGAQIGKSVTAKTSILFRGLKVGETKISAAKEKGVDVITEQDFLNLISE
ncbi:MAG: helix-hairpin-helix domain-containing protein, partial [Thalassotalea sp.]|nr:helix-hairpin-helix domain-containing protein [Thalassotalea sp.]